MIMLMHGRLLVTAHGMMLDEMRSLLQKSLRRKRLDLITQSTRELIGYGKDQLPWRCIMTYLFEDHCLAGGNLLQTMLSYQSKNDKYNAILFLSKIPTCRISCCAPVVALDPEYLPNHWDSDLEVDQELTGLVTIKTGCINFDSLLMHLKMAWEENNNTKMMTYFKMVTIAYDTEKRVVSRKGDEYLKWPLKSKRPNLHVGLIVLSLLYRVTKEEDFKKYIRCCYAFCTLPEAPVRLILFTVLIQRMYKDKSINEVGNNTESDKIKWSEVGVLSSMPSWAVDKHTYRGKTGNQTVHLVKKKRLHKQLKLNEEFLETFHSERPKNGIQHFFDEGCVCLDPAAEENPFWERTKEIYFSKTHSLQKTVRMTADYYNALKKSHKMILCSKQKSSRTVDEDDEMDVVDDRVKNRATKRGHSSAVETQVNVPKASTSHDDDIDKKSISRKRKHSEKEVKIEKTEKKIRVKKVKFDDDTANKDNILDCETRSESTSQSIPMSSRPTSSTDTEVARGDADGKESGALVKMKGPLLQLPTGSAKVYTCLDTSIQRVWKGPYKPERLGLLVFLHKAMRDIIGDPHTLPI